MKNLMILLAALSLAGCTPEKKGGDADPLAAKVAGLEKKVADLETLTSIQARTLRDQSTLVATNDLQIELLFKRTRYVVDDLSFLTAAYYDHAADTNKHARARVVYYTPASAAPAAKPAPETRGVPPAVFEQIKAKAAADWPLDFHMQDYRIRTEVEAYKKVNQ